MPPADTAERACILRLLQDARADLIRADTRALGFLSLAAVAIALFGGVLLAGDWTPANLPVGAQIGWWAGTTLAIPGLHLLVTAAIPTRHQHGDGTRIGYYGHVAAAADSPDTLAAALAASTSNELEILSDQLKTISAIVVGNNRQIRRGVILLAASVYCLAVSVLAGMATGAGP